MKKNTLLVYGLCISIICVFVVMNGRAIDELKAENVKLKTKVEKLEAFNQGHMDECAYFSQKDLYVNKNGYVKSRYKDGVGFIAGTTNP